MYVCVAGRKKRKTGQQKRGQQNTIQLYFNTFLTWATKHTIQQIHSPVSKTWDKAQLQPISKYMYQQTTHLFLREREKKKKKTLYIHSSKGGQSNHVEQKMILIILIYSTVQVKILHYLLLS